MISSVIIHLSSDPVLKAEGIAAIRKRADCELGDLIGGQKLPIAIESNDENSMIATHRWLQSCPGVAFVDVVFIHWDDGRSETVEGGDGRFSEARI